MTASFSDYRERRQIIRQIYPDDLLEDLKDSEPELYQEAQICDSYLSGTRPMIQNSVSAPALLSSILTQGWDRPKKQKYDKNWPDMENLLKLYAIGLYFKDQPQTYQAKYDVQELQNAIQKASISPRHKKGISAIKRLQCAGTYLAYGLKNLDAFFIADRARRAQELDCLEWEIFDTHNQYNAYKLQKSRSIALRVGHIICARYKEK